MEKEQWTKRDTLTLIKLWKECPCLYDYSIKDYFDRDLREEKYDYMVKELKKTGKIVNKSQLKRKIRTLQSQVSKEKKKNIKNFENTINLDSEVYEPKLWCFKELSFLASTSFANKLNVDQVKHLEGLEKKGDNTINETYLSSNLDFEFIESDEKVETLYSDTSNDISLTNENQKQEIKHLPKVSKEVNSTSHEIKEYFETFSEFIEEENSIEKSLSPPFSNEIVLKNENQILTVSKKPNSTNNITKKPPENYQNHLEEREEAFCKYLATELKQITDDDLFHELKLDILQLVNNKLKYQNFILKQESALNIGDYISFIS